MIAYLSSTYIDLLEYRAAATAALERLGQQVERMEVYGARSEEPLVACLADVRAADLFIGVYAHRYGHTPAANTCSITEQEFDEATRHHKPRFCFLIDPNQPWPPKFIEPGEAQVLLARFKERLQASAVCDTFTSPVDLSFRIAASVGRHLLRPQPSSEIVERAQQNPYTAVLQSAVDLRDLLHRALRELESITGTDYNQVFLAAVKSHMLQLTCVADAIPAHKPRYRLATLAGLLGAAYTTGDPINSVDVHQHRGYFVAVVETRSELVVPIKCGAAVVGVLNSESERIAHYHLETQKRVELLAAALGSCMPKAGWRAGIPADELPWIELRPRVELEA